MRLVLAITILTVSAAGAQAAEDRYGPPRDRPGTVSGQIVAAPYTGPMLTWTGKTSAPTAATPASAPIPTMPQPLAPWAGPAGPAPGQRAAPYPSIYAPAPAPIAAAYTPAPQAPATAVQRPLPTSLYDRAAAAPMAAAPASPVAAPASTPAPRPAAPTRPQAAMTPAPSAPSPVRAAGDSGRSKAYSVLREFGGVPDPIDIPPPTSYWATRPETAPVDAIATDMPPGGGVGSDEVADANGEQDISEAARRRERERDRARAAAAEARR